MAIFCQFYNRLKSPKFEDWNARKIFAIFQYRALLNPFHPAFFEIIFYTFADVQTCIRQRYILFILQVSAINLFFHKVAQTLQIWLVCVRLRLKIRHLTWRRDIYLWGGNCGFHLFAAHKDAFRLCWNPRAQSLQESYFLYCCIVSINPASLQLFAQHEIFIDREKKRLGGVLEPGARQKSRVRTYCLHTCRSSSPTPI